MSEPNPQEEPTMEEILASIRRIISEEDPESGAVPEAQAEPESAEGEDDEAVLELTDRVEGDEQVVELTDRMADLAPEPEPEPESTADPTDPFEIEEAEPEIGMAEPESEIEMEEAEPEIEMADVEPETEAEEAESATGEADIESGHSQPPQPEQLVSDQTAAAATATLASIYGAVAAEPRNADNPIAGPGRTLEDVVRDALAPELKAWLDSHLSGLVERIVREEIKKMVRRAEEL